MEGYVDAPGLDSARERLSGCRNEAAGELARLHQELMDLEAQLTHRAELEEEIVRQEQSLVELERQGEELRETIVQGEAARSALGGRREQIEAGLRRELTAHLEACPLEDAPAAVKRALSEISGTLSRLAEQERELQGKLCRKRELERQIPQEEQELHTLEGDAARLREELAGSRSRQEEMEGQIRAQRDRLPFPEEEQARQKIAALGEEREGLSEALAQAQDAAARRQKELAAADAAIEELRHLLEGAQVLDTEDLQQQGQALGRQRTEAAEAQKTIHARLAANQTALKNIREKTADLEKLERRYTWMRALSNTVNGTLAGKEKIALETYVQMTFFDRILQRANLRLLVMSGG